MKIESPLYGSLDMEPSKIIEFPRGLPGFEDLRRFSLFHPEGEAPAYFILQSVDDPAVAFHVTDPVRFGFNYEISLSDEETETLALTDINDAAVVVILLRDGSGAGEAPLRANLNAPLVLNVTARRGLQHIFTRLDYKVGVAS
ncbi:MAG: flagellar biosynthesis protein FliW [Rhodocyclaceae bacterium]|nr:flagellar biosynthesis protein FliW [Rhodocyclaceae bacterium]